MKFLLDEHIAPIVARELSRRGHDAIALQDLADLLGSTDRELLEVAWQLDRALVTADAATLQMDAEARRVSGRDHAGVVLISPERFSLSRRNPGRLIAALDVLAGTRPAIHLRGRVVWLQRPTHDE